ncbi:MAG TPA: hypothetical protein PK530_04070 [Anaerolineales bacterium]|nr:hypothetical protein [Anaerolineales bacterium]
MKTYRNLYPQVHTFENLYLAYRKARKGKRSKAPAAAFERVQEQGLFALQDELQTRTYTPGPYESFTSTTPSTASSLPRPSEIGSSITPSARSSNPFGSGG